MDANKFTKTYYLVESIACAVAIICTVLRGIALYRVEKSGAQPDWHTLWGFYISTLAFATMALIEFVTNLVKHIYKGEN